VIASMFNQHAKWLGILQSHPRHLARTDRCLETACISSHGLAQITNGFTPPRPGLQSTWPATRAARLGAGVSAGEPTGLLAWPKRRFLETNSVQTSLLSDKAEAPPNTSTIEAGPPACGPRGIFGLWSWAQGKTMDPRPGEEPDLEPGLW